MWHLRKATPEEHMRAKALHQDLEAQDKKRRQQFGEIKPVVQCAWDSQKKNVLAVGNTVCVGDFKTFPDFLMLYLRERLTKDWLTEGLQQTSSIPHPILLWLKDVISNEAQWRVMKQDGRWVRPSGAAMCFFTLAYDLFVLRNHGHIQEPLICRIKQGDFQAARYELFVAAAMIRAGFTLDFEDESDNTQKHPEFIATDPKTGVRIAVEAKSKLRRGVLGHTDGPQRENEFELRVEGLIRKALKKKFKMPYIIFVDMNMPPELGESAHRRWIEQLGKAAASADAPHGNDDPFTALIFTNTPQHYHAFPQVVPSADCIPLMAQKPTYPLPDASLIATIYEGVKKYGAIPFNLDDAS